jgi:hypothetical protein
MLNGYLLEKKLNSYKKAQECESAESERTQQRKKQRVELAEGYRRRVEHFIQGVRRLLPSLTARWQLMQS